MRYPVIQSDFNMFYGERVKYKGKHPLLKDQEGEIVGGDEHNFIVKWDNLEVLREHSAYDCLWLQVDRGEPGKKWLQLNSEG